MSQQTTISNLTQIVPPGTVLYLARSTVPNGYIKANGATISRSTYDTLFSAIDTTFGAGDGWIREGRWEQHRAVLFKLIHTIIDGL